MNRIERANMNSPRRLAAKLELPSGWAGRLFFATALIVLGALGGAAIPILGAFSPLAIFGLIAAISLPAIWILTSNHQLDKLLIGILLAILLQDLPSKVTTLSTSGALQAMMIAISPVGLYAYIRAAQNNKALLWANIAFLTFLLIGVLSTIFGRSLAPAAAYQLVSNLKPILFIAMFYAISWQEKTESIFISILKYAWIPMVALGVFEWVAPNLYMKIFPMTLKPMSAAETLHRATGIFTFPGTLAAISAQLAIFFILRQVHSTPTKEINNTIHAAGYICCIILALSKGEMISFAICCVMVVAFHKREGVLARLAMMIAVLAVCSPIFYLFFGESIQGELDAAGITRATGEIDHPRTQIFTYSFLMAQKYWPLGAGLGTYAGAGAQKFDTSLYDLLGFNKFWWYGRQDFLMDTYWPNPIAETGYIGTTLLLACYISLFFYAFKQWRRSASCATPYWGAAASGMLFTIVNSMSTPAFLELRTYFFVAIFFGIAHNAEKRNITI